MEFEGYCVKCREKRTVTGGEVKETPNGRQMAQGKCPVCGTTVTRFMAGGGGGTKGDSGGTRSKSKGTAGTDGGSKGKETAGGRSGRSGK
jgi:hypothetical protein